MQIPMLHSAFTMTSPVKLGVSLGFNGLSAAARTGCCFHISKGFSGWRQKWGLMQSSSTSEPRCILCFFCDRRVNAQTGLIQPGVTMPRRARKEKKKNQTNKHTKAAAPLAVFQPSANSTENCWRGLNINPGDSTLFVDTAETH